MTLSTLSAFRPLIAILALLSLPTETSRADIANEIDQELRQILLSAVNQADSFEDRFDAQVWLMDMSNRIDRYVDDDKERLHILRTAHHEATRAGLPPALVLSVIHTESLFQRFAISVAGAQGLMQVMSFWKKELGRPEDNLTNIDTNLRYGCTILAYYLRRANGDISEALARYNGSYGKMKYPNKVYANQLRYQD
ncbi:MAG: soluble lytic murein transglycosylase-like protein [Motiliproteus sp.]|jgi:soluble lytic murein transglycosylase-like protein